MSSASGKSSVSPPRARCNRSAPTASLIIRSFIQVVEDGYEFFAKRQLVTLFSAPNYCGEFDNAGAMMSVDETLLCSFQVSSSDSSSSWHTCASGITSERDRWW